MKIPEFLKKFVGRLLSALYKLFKKLMGAVFSRTGMRVALWAALVGFIIIAGRFIYANPPAMKYTGFAYVAIPTLVTAIVLYRIAHWR